MFSPPNWPFLRAEVAYRRSQAEASYGHSAAARGRRRGRRKGGGGFRRLWNLEKLAFSHKARPDERVGDLVAFVPKMPEPADCAEAVAIERSEPA